jgi:hypothetical protein
VGRRLSSTGKTNKEDVPATPKQNIEHVATEEQQSSIAFCEGNSFGQQSCTPSVEADK